MSSVEDEASAVSAAVARLTTAYSELQEKVDDLENLTMRNNLCIIGLPGKITCQLCLSTSAPLLFQRNLASARPAWSGAHIASGNLRKPAPNLERSLSNYADKRTIFQKYRHVCNLSVDNHHFLLFADYSIEVMRQRKAFSSVCSTLQ